MQCVFNNACYSDLAMHSCYLAFTQPVCCIHLLHPCWYCYKSFPNQGLSACWVAEPHGYHGVSVSTSDPRCYRNYKRISKSLDSSKRHFHLILVWF